MIIIYCVVVPESDALVTSSVTACSAEDPSPQEEIPTATAHLEVITQKPQLDTKNGKSRDSCVSKSEQLNGKQILNSDNMTTKLHSDNEAESAGQSKSTQQDPQQLEPTHVNCHSEDGDEMGDRVHIARKSDNTTIVENVSKKQVEHEEFHDDAGADNHLQLQSAPENELQENLNQPENENLTCQQDWQTDNIQRRNHFDDGVQETTTDATKNKYKLHNGKNLSSENIGLQNGD